MSRLDVSQHMALCRHYVRELRRTNLFGTPELEKAGSKRSSTILDNVTEAGPSNEKDKTTPEQRLSAFLRENDTIPRHSPQNSVGTTDSARSNTEPPRPSFMAGSTADSSPMQDSSGNQQSTPDQHTVTRNDIRASAEKILYTYLLPGSEREIILPQSILDRITHDIEVENRDDPEVFDTAKDYVFQAMERDAFPGFLRCKAFGNIVPPSMMVRLIIGLLAMFGGFWAAFTLIFLNHSRSNRCWVSFPPKFIITPNPVKVMANFLGSICSSSSPSRSASTRWPRTSTCSTRSSSSPAAARRRSAASARSASRSSRSCSSSAPSWSCSSSSSPTPLCARCSSSFRASVYERRREKKKKRDGALFFLCDLAIWCFIPSESGRANLNSWLWISPHWI